MRSIERSWRSQHPSLRRKHEVDIAEAQKRSKKWSDDGFRGTWPVRLFLLKDGENQLAIRAVHDMGVFAVPLRQDWHVSEQLLVPHASKCTWRCWCSHQVC